MNEQHILSVLNHSFHRAFESVTLFRDSGNCTYTVEGLDKSYFLKVIRHPFLETGLASVHIQRYLLEHDFPVIPILLTKEGSPCIRIRDQDADYLFVLYEFIAGDEPAPGDTEEVGALIGVLHRMMRNYPGKLKVQEKHFFIDRYISILREKQYPSWEAFRDYGNVLWERVKNLPRGYCHGDLYVGNIHKTREGTLYVVDFDTSCLGFPMYDAVLFCNETDYFSFSEDGYQKATDKLECFMRGYLREHTLSGEEIAAFYELIAVYHFQLQATIIEVNGLGCVDNGFLDGQLDWLLRWKKQCEAHSSR